jgi:dephospho-CoA kinase
VSAPRTHVIGLTGGIASGKSTVARELRARGAVVIDADQLAREVVAPGEPALTELVTRFGSGILDEQGELDRKQLGALVFADAGARAEVNRITHPRIAARSQAEIAAAAARGVPVVFYEAALLVENGAHRGLDALIVVAAAEDRQIERLRARDGLDPTAARARIAAQAPMVEKLAAATWVLHNDSDPDVLKAELDALVPVIETRFGSIA